MITKMDLNLKPECVEELEIEEYLNLLHKSKEVKAFLSTMQEYANNANVFRYSARIKNIKSAIRTYRINKKTLKDVHDYIGMWFIANEEEDIKEIVQFLNNKFKDAEIIDLLGEDSIYSPLVYLKWTPPLNYTLFAKEELIPNVMKVPLEIRVTYRDAYISDQAAYFSIHKNDKTTLSNEKRKLLRSIVQHVIYKITLLNTRKLTSSEYEKHLNE